MNMLREKLKNPVIAAFFAILIGFTLGLIWGWNIQPVEWSDATPELLRSDYQQDYLRMTIDSFLVNSDTTLTLRRWQSLGPAAPDLLEEISQAPGSQNKASIDAYGQLMNATTPNIEAPETALIEDTQVETSSTTRYILIGAGVIAVLAVAFFTVRLLRPISSKGGQATPAQQAMQFNQNTAQTDYAELGLAAPITQSMTTYVLGDDLYDESFSIESQGGEFMGEFGVGIADTIGVGDPKKVAALEIWLFDKNDIKTATKVLMSQHAFNDPDTRQRLEAKGELVLAQSQSPVKLETETLQLLVTVTDLEYGSGPLPPNSYFDRSILELAIWPKTN
ncbi:MAG: hypothetical protein ISR59_13245 [Anaerolineales bacterium]|uniref:Uncharacterized protein n=1 Tax=Candidatus Desulfolinea nitratireducens TaxID=2841698 RepID=A0A8J6TF23_9CHLR|nr:hypothetical protein [Candidatus Desulfolinea nitratireducens]MBL6962066.1 hypothetical protein [Anaerolineales bacterium]